MFGCTFSCCEFINGLLLGTIASLFGATIVLLCQKIILRKRYKFLEGKYDGYGFRDDDLTLRKQDPQSKAEINYKNDNKLEIIVSHGSGNNQRTWSGMITMELETYGSIVWQYKSEQDYEFNFGLKRCIVKRENEKVYLLLIGESLMDGTYKEQFEGNIKEIIVNALKPNKELFIKKQNAI